MFLFFWRVETFLKEYRRIQKLSKENDRIADFLGIVLDSTKIVILYEFASNGNVKDKISDVPLSEAMALKYFYQTADALEFLHSQRTPVIHMDIKAANILLSATDNIKLANFGLVRDLTIGGFGMAVASEITEDFRATLLYVAPEVLQSEYGPGDRRAYSASADIWSLGCTLVEMLTCFPPYFEFYDDNCDNFYNDVVSRTTGPAENQLPYDCFSLVPTSSTIIRFIVHKIFDKTPSTRISAEGLLNFLQSLTAENLHHKEKLEGEFQKAYESSQKTIHDSLQYSSTQLPQIQSHQTTAAKKRGIFQSIKGLSIQSLTKIRGSGSNHHIDAPRIKGPSLSSSDSIFFGCCMVALGEYKYRVANKSLHKSKFFVRRPPKDIRIFGFRIIRAKRLVLKEFKADFEDDEEETREIPQHVDEDDDRYCQIPTPIPFIKEDLEAAAVTASVNPPPPPPPPSQQWPSTIVEEATRKLATTAFSPLGNTFQDLYNDEPPPSPAVM
uniref:Protein kinase domain-containing protein n=1 Tax=Panagrolaimus superbus TaxID=310955 RepID=A0A914XZY7_9BILA